VASVATVRIACKRESTVITRFIPGEEIYAFDHAGRLFTAWRGHRLYRRALDGRIMEKHTDRTGRHPRRLRRFLEPTERRALVDEAAAAAREALAALSRAEADVIWSLPGPQRPEQVRQLVTAASRFTAEAAEADRRRFESVYAPVAILPPDRYLALVVQATEGCHWNRCTFCSFYRDRPFRVKPYAEFVQHVEDVIAFFGRGLSLRRGVFLGDANALLLPPDLLVPRLDHLRRRLPALADDVSAFVDVFTGHRRQSAELAPLSDRGLRRIYAGLESGDDELLKFLNKPQTAAEAVELVHAARAAGLRVGIIVMAGIGGRAYWKRHVAATVATIAQMRLGVGDLAYVSAFEAPSHGPYAERARASGIVALDQTEVADQVDELLRAIAGVVESGARVAPYDIQEFLY
jgi:hypothetical protein